MGTTQSTFRNEVDDNLDSFLFHDFDDIIESSYKMGNKDAENYLNKVYQTIINRKLFSKQMTKFQEIDEPLTETSCNDKTLLVNILTKLASSDLFTPRESKMENQSPLFRRLRTSFLAASESIKTRKRGKEVREDDSQSTRKELIGKSSTTFHYEESFEKQRDAVVANDVEGFVPRLLKAIKLPVHGFLFSGTSTSTVHLKKLSEEIIPELKLSNTENILEPTKIKEELKQLYHGKESKDTHLTDSPNEEVLATFNENRSLQCSTTIRSIMWLLLGKAPWQNKTLKYTRLSRLLEDFQMCKILEIVPPLKNPDIVHEEKFVFQLQPKKPVGNNEMIHLQVPEHLLMVSSKLTELKMPVSRWNIFQEPQELKESPVKSVLLERLMMALGETGSLDDVLLINYQEECHSWWPGQRWVDGLPGCTAGWPPSYSFQDNDCPLMTYVNSGSWVSTEMMARMRPLGPRELLARDESGNTALHVAAGAGEDHVVRALLSVARKLQDDYNPFFTDNRLTQTLVCCFNNRQQTAVHLSSAGGHVTVLLQLLQECVTSVGLRDENDELPLHYACRFGSLACVRLLTAFGGIRFTSGVEGMTPLQLAAAGGHLEVVRELVFMCGESLPVVEICKALACARTREIRHLLQLLLVRYISF